MWRRHFSFSALGLSKLVGKAEDLVKDRVKMNEAIRDAKMKAKDLDKETADLFKGDEIQAFPWCCQLPVIMPGFVSRVPEAQGEG